MNKNEAARQVIQDKCKNSLYLFIREILGYKEVNLNTHGPFIQALQDDSLRKLLVMPRGTFKSTIGCVAYPIWKLIQNPNERICIDSEVYDNSVKFLREIKAHMESPALTEIFGVFRGDIWTDSELVIKQRTQAFPQASISAMGTTTSRVGQHYSIIVCDDLNSDKNSATPEQREKIIRHYQMLTSILEPNGVMSIIGTRYAQNDVIGFILEKELGLKSIPVGYSHYSYAS